MLASKSIFSLVVIDEVTWVDDSKSRRRRAHIRPRHGSLVNKSLVQEIDDNAKFYFRPCIYTLMICY